MSKFKKALTLLLCAALNNVQGEVTTSRLQVQIPKSLNVVGGYDHREALFGIPSYGGGISQHVYYADSDLCEPNVDTHKGYPIRPLDAETKKMEPWPSPFILMVDRGTCTFVQKVRNAQRVGAAAVIVADNTCLCDAEGEAETQCHSDPNAPLPCQARSPIMADDGSGADITIPSFLMHKQDADKVKAEVMANHVVQIEMAWATPAPDDRVEYDLWSLPNNAISKNFVTTFRSAAKALDKHAYFTPHQFFYDGLMFNCQGKSGENACHTLCTNNGRYCATDPDDDLDSGISGADVVTEILRRICIYKHYGEEDGIAENYWKYMEKFSDRCEDPDFFKNEDCLNDVYKHAEIDGGVIEQCMKDSGGLEGDVSNSFLDKELQAKKDSGVVVIPAVYVNNAVMRGALTSANVFRAICSGFLEGTEPDICKACVASADQDIIKCTEDGYSPNVVNPTSKSSSSKKGISRGQFVFSLMLVSGIFVALGVWQYRKSQREMRDQVRGILAEYMPLDEDGKDADGSFSFATASDTTQIA